MKGAFSLVIALLASACTSQADHGGFGEAVPSATSPSPAAQPAPEGPVQRVAVSAPGGFRYDPDLLQVRAGGPAEFEFVNRDTREHTFVLGELAIAMLAGAGQTVRTSVPIDRKNRGRFTFFCSISGHRDSGMEGTIEVR